MARADRPLGRHFGCHFAPSSLSAIYPALAGVPLGMHGRWWLPPPSVHRLDGPARSRFSFAYVAAALLANARSASSPRFPSLALAIGFTFIASLSRSTWWRRRSPSPCSPRSAPATLLVAPAPRRASRVLRGWDPRDSWLRALIARQGGVARLTSPAAGQPARSRRDRRGGPLRASPVRALAAPTAQALLWRGTQPPGTLCDAGRGRRIDRAARVLGDEHRPSTLASGHRTRNEVVLFIWFRRICVACEARGSVLAARDRTTIVAAAVLAGWEPSFTELRRARSGNHRSYAAAKPPRCRSSGSGSPRRRSRLCGSWVGSARRSRSRGPARPKVAFAPGSERVDAPASAFHGDHGDGGLTVTGVIGLATGAASAVIQHRGGAVSWS